MSIPKIAAVVFLTIALAVLGREISFFFGKNVENGKKYTELEKKLAETQASYNGVKNDLDYYLNPYNLEKELRARFNYRSAGEKLLIIVPQPSSTTK